MKSRISKVTISLLIAALTLTGCGSQTADSQKQKSPTATLNGVQVDPNGTIHVGIIASVLTLDPANHRDRVTETVIRNIFDGLVTRTTDGKIVPEIAESWNAVSPTVWEFKIRKGVTFHDGSPLTAEDVKFTFDRIIGEGAMEGKTSPRKGLLAAVKSIDKIDDYNIRFNLSSPWPILLQMLPHQQIIPKAYFEKVGVAEFVKKPIGAGPFKLVEAKLDEKVVLERYDKYYGGSPDLQPVGPAQAKTVIFDVIPENSTRLAALKSGEVQIIQNVPTDMVEQLKADTNENVMMVNGTNVYMFQINTKKAPFDNVKVRQAMNYAINVQEIVDKILNGNAIRLAGPVLSTSPFLNQTLKPYPYDPNKAKELLKEASYPNGFSLVIDAEAKDKTVAETAAANLRQVGINASVRIWDWGVLKPMLLNGERQVVLTTWGNSTQDPSDLLEPTLKPKGGGNYSMYDNKEVTGLIDKASVSVDDKVRRELYDQAQQIIYDEAPWVFGFSGKAIEASSKRIVNWKPSMDGRINLHDVGIQAK
ncbi:MAG: ABC transporter substrate-binding protein [Desulfitobacteriaceae bacterium]